MKDDESPIHILWLPTIFMAGVAYVVSFIDLIPGIGPISLLDDIIVILVMVWFFTSWLPKNRHRIYWFRPKAQSGSEGRRKGTPGPDEEMEGGEFDPFAILDVPRGAGPEEIRKAYRELLSKYHPDKVSHLGEEFQKTAHEKTVEIQRAYEMLCGKG